MPLPKLFELLHDFKGKDSEPQLIVNLNSYEPGSSSTSEVLLCNSSYCSEPCPLPAAPTPPPCPYEINYMFENTLSRGFLVQDLMHLETYTNHNATKIHPPVVFGCGEVETGLFLGRGDLNGLLGLGHTSLDVTTLLSSQGLIRNSFSMCFAPDGNGRIAFGDKGDADQRVTPLVDARASAQYVRVDRIYVNDVVTDVGFEAMFDSGTSLTYLAGEAYAVVTKAFVSLVKDQQRIELVHPFFEYCYIPGTGNNASFGIPSLIFNTKGGANFSVMSPMFSIKIPQQVYCLAIVNNKINTLNIIGHNYLTGYRIIFDRERSILGWKPSNCISKEANTTASNASVLSAMESILFFFLVSFSFSHVM
ncbi:unnamed protein product [Cuscuta campestris]|uniref:Peptidase A1 domain-containing protein n=1 Tax=Cuscuta campestris TaxID=132261 RepID=A0A484N5H9_9ASTE|nr:unnamed protein product [Cuscuta campestris]